MVAVDRLANRHRFHPGLLLDLCARYRGHRGVARIPGVVALASPYSGSPMETRLRLLIIGACTARLDRIVAELTRARRRAPSRST